MVYLLYLTVIFYTTKLERLDGNGLTFRFRFNVVAVDRREMRTIYCPIATSLSICVHRLINLLYVLGFVKFTSVSAATSKYVLVYPPCSQSYCMTGSVSVQVARTRRRHPLLENGSVSNCQQCAEQTTTVQSSR